MKTNVVIAALLGASTILAAPTSEMRRQRRQARLRQTQPRQNVTDGLLADGAMMSDVSDVQYSSNWAGAVLVGSGYTTVRGSIVVPMPQEPSGADASTQYAASAWVGIDGDTCSSAILQTGVDFYIQGGQVTYDAWYEWFPDYAYFFDGFTLNAGDTIDMTVTASGLSAGVAVLENRSTGQSVSHSFSSETANLCQTNAEWIIEDFSNGNSQVPFANFDTVTFTNAVAETGGSTVDTTGATIIDMNPNGQVMTSCSASGSEVTCSYV